VLGVVALVALVAVLVGTVAVFSAQDDVEPVAQDRLGPVLLVPGYGGSLGVLDPIRIALEEQGRLAVMVPALGDGTGDLDAQAENLAEVADRTLAESGASSLDVIGFSAGGLVARLWVKDHGGAALARRVLTIGSPHHGTAVAETVLGGVGDCSTACEQMVPDSDLLRSLNAGDETPDGPRFVSVWSVVDRVAVPPTTAALDGAALNLSVQSVCPDDVVAHGGLPADPVVLALLSTALGTGPPATPTDVDCG